MATAAVGALGVLESRKQRKQAQRGAQQADPFASQRGGFQDLLAQMFGLPTAGQQRGQSLQGANRAGIQSQLEKAQESLKVAGTGPRRNKFQATQAQGQIDQLTQQLADFDAQDQTAAQAQQRQQGGGDLLSQIPGLQFAIEQGNKAAGRRASAQGFGRSGNILEEIARQTTGTALQGFTQQADLLGRLSGAFSGSPGTAGQITAGAPTSLGGIGGVLGTLPSIGGGGGATSVTSSQTPVNVTRPFAGQSLNLGL